MDEFDHLFDTARALGEETRFRIYRELCVSDQPVSIGDLAASFSLHPNAIRQHISRLEQAGLIVSTLQRGNGAGRPRRLFEANAEPLDFPHPPRTTRALIAILAEAVDTLPSDRRSLVTFGRAWGKGWGLRRRRENGARPRSRQGRGQLLTAQLAEWGWKPATKRDVGRFVIETRRCLFSDLAPRANGRCHALEEGLVRGIVEATANRRHRVTRVEGCLLRILL
ncbi:MAG: helix-turn-helix transcriptional regulator [Actinomycetota bacterium]